MKSKTIVISVILVAALIVFVLVYQNKFQRNMENGNMQPTPTMIAKTVTPSPTISSTITTMPTPVSVTKVLSYVSVNGFVSLNFKQAMSVYEYMETATKGWIVISMNPINIDNPQANGLIINFQKPSIEGKGGACASGFKSNAMYGQTIQYCETMKELSGGYLKNAKSEMEYAFYITAKGVSEKDVYKEILFNGLSLE